MKQEAMERPQGMGNGIDQVFGWTHSRKRKMTWSQRQRLAFLYLESFFFFFYTLKGYWQKANKNTGEKNPACRHITYTFITFTFICVHELFLNALYFLSKSIDTKN